ncbi:MFS transporter [Nonomuraea salmonea]|uniref:MFS transporter n=1 Tax=Nonomuraea salmonea TaxID=46181 RepID=UPI0031E6308F
MLLATLLAVLTLGNLITAVSPSYPLVLGTRLVMGFASGVFWGIGVAMAMRLVPERHASRAASVVMSGISIGAVAGIPLGTALESLTDWRTTFLIWSGLSALVFVAVAVLVPLTAVGERGVGAGGVPAAAAQRAAAAGADGRGAVRARALRGLHVRAAVPGGARRRDAAVRDDHADGVRRRRRDREPRRRARRGQERQGRLPRRERRAGGVAAGAALPRSERGRGGRHAGRVGGWRSAWCS